MIEQYTGQSIENGVVRFTADWCQPCKVYAPIFERVAETTDTPFYVIDVEKYKDLAWDLRVQSLPTVAAAKNGEWVIFQRPYDEAQTRAALEHVES